MNILIVRPEIYQIKSITSMGISVSVLLIWDRFTDPISAPIINITDPKINLFEIKNDKSGLFQSITRLFTIYRILKNKHYDIIQLNGLRDLIEFWFLRIFLRTKPLLITTSLNSFIWKRKYLNGLINLYINLFSDGYIALNSKNMRLMKKLGFPKDKICFIPNAFLTPLHFSHGIHREKNPNSISIVYVASVIRSKSPETICYAISKLKKRITNIKVRLVGSTTIDKEYYCELMKLAKDLDIVDQVKFTGQVGHNEVLNIYETADIVVFPSKSEMMPRAVIEAMWLGKPVIATAIDGILDLIINHQTGLLFSPGDYDELAELITELIEQPELAQKLASAGQSFVQEFCSLENVGKQYKVFYEQIINQH